MNNIYVVLLSAYDRHLGYFAHDVNYLFCISDDIAKAKAMSLCKMTFPGWMGYSGHDVQVKQIDNNDIAESYLKHL